MINEILRKIGEPTYKQKDYAWALLQEPVGVIVHVKKTKNQTCKQLYAYLEKEAKVISTDTFEYLYKNEKEHLYLKYSGYAHIVDTIHKLPKGELVSATEIKEELKGVSALIEQAPDKQILVPKKEKSKVKEQKEEECYEKERKTRSKNKEEVKGSFFKKNPSGILGEVINVIKDGMKKKD